MSQFISDVQKLRAEARASIEKGALTSANTADRGVLIEALDKALATEWICVLRYSQHALAAAGIHAEAVAEHFQEHAREELEHAHRLGERIKQLGGTPSLDPNGFRQRAHSEYVECQSLAEMIRENLVAERIAVASYTELIRWIGESDPTSRRLIEDILETEEEHADELADLLVTFDPRGSLN